MTKPYYKKEWIEKRKEVIGTECAWCGSTKKLQIHHVDYSTFEAYKNLSDDTFITICRKCHYMFHEGRDLCPSCKEKGTIKYKNSWFPTCWQCAHPDEIYREEDKEDTFFGLITIEEDEEDDSWGHFFEELIAKRLDVENDAESGCE